LFIGSNHDVMGFFIHPVNALTHCTAIASTLAYPLREWQNDPYDF
jgi:hypothetical protein